jgi:hypothetical protein
MRGFFTSHPPLRGTLTLRERDGVKSGSLVFDLFKSMLRDDLFNLFPYAQALAPRTAREAFANFESLFDGAAIGCIQP